PGRRRRRPRPGAARSDPVGAGAAHVPGHGRGAGVTFLGSVVAWFADPRHWQGGDGIPVRVFEHLELTGLSVLVAAAVALPIGLYLGHTGRAAFLAVNLANLG